MMEFIVLATIAFFLITIVYIGTHAGETTN
jgi:hypothetical protein